MRLAVRSSGGGNNREEASQSPLVVVVVATGLPRSISVTISSFDQ